MESLIKLNGQLSGRDKLARLVQYSCRTLWDCLQGDSNIELIDKIKTLEYILSSFRKLLRFGKCADVLYASLKTIHNPDVTLRLTLTLSKISQAIFLFADHIIWLSAHRTGEKIEHTKMERSLQQILVLFHRHEFVSRFLRNMSHIRHLPRCSTTVAAVLLSKIVHRFGQSLVQGNGVR
ncbi:hypothetical protein HA402_016047 [Bradysia odoriphaga]|nr:hypothetical protein HA402_016047 [Bradysia odoriphaga]